MRQKRRKGQDGRKSGRVDDNSRYKRNSRAAKENGRPVPIGRPA